MCHKIFWLTVAVFLFSNCNIFSDDIAFLYGQSHIPFIANQGQVDDDVAYYAHVFNGAVFVTTKGNIVYSLDGVCLWEEALDGKVDDIIGINQVNISISDFHGLDKGRWLNNIPAYDIVDLGEVYDGIELKLKAYGNNVEKLFIVKPGARPEAIKVRLNGCREIRLDRKGRLEAVTEAGTVNFTCPEAYQIIDGIKKYVDAAYAINDKEYGFEVGRYDLKYPLIIDPLLASTYLGGNGQEGWDYIPTITMTLDQDRNVFVAGMTRSLDFPTTPGAIQGIVDGDYDIFIAQFDSELTTLLASTVLGGEATEERPTSIVADAEGNVFVVGATNSTDFPTTPSANDPNLSGSHDIFISKLDGSLTTLLASTYLGGDGSEQDCSMALDPGGNVFVVGVTPGTGFPTTSGAYSEEYNGGSSDLYITKFAPDLSSILASTFVGGSRHDERSPGIAIDYEGNIFLLGSTGSDDYPTTAFAYDDSFNGPFTLSQYDLDLCVSKLSNDLTTLLASTFFGGAEFERAYQITVDDNGNVYLTGHTASLDFPIISGAFDENHNGFDETFVSKLDGNLSNLLGSTYFTPDGVGGGYFIGMETDDNGDLWLAGGSASIDFPVTGNGYDTTYNGGEQDAIIVKLGADCDTLLYSSFLGGSGRELDAAIAVVNPDEIFVTGYTNGGGFPVTPMAYDTNYHGNQDAYIAKLALKQFTRITDGPHINTNGLTLGVNWIDYDNDDYPDLFVPVRDGLNRLYRNNGDGSYSEVPGNIIIQDGNSNGGCWADFDNDGDLDAYVHNGLHENLVNYYYLNNGDGTFTKITDDIIATEAAASMVAVCADYDNDGVLDIFTTTWLFSGICPVQLYHGIGNGHFTKITEGPIVEYVDPTGGAYWTDYDDDGDQDLVVSTPDAGESDIIYKNAGGEFTVVTGFDYLNEPRGQDYNFGDFDNDGDQDLFIPTWEGNNSALYENLGGGNFSKITDQPITSDGHWSTAGCLGDFDNDGDLDIFLVNDNNSEARPDYFYINDGTGYFTSFVDSAYVDDPGSFSCKVAPGDYDRDGDLDLYLANWYTEEPDLLYRNNGNSNGWIIVKPEGTESNRSAIGSKVRVLANIGGSPVWQMRELRSHVSSRAQSPLELHFGLGDAAIIDSLIVEWPSGILQILTDVDVNQILGIVEEMPLYICGDANGDEGVNVGDVVYLVNLIFHNGPMPDPEEAGDVNCDGNVNVGDAVYLGNYIFQPDAPLPCAPCASDILAIPAGISVTVDGVIETGEWADAAIIGISIADKVDVTIRVKHDNSSFLAAYTYSFIGEPALCFPEVNFDVNNDKSETRQMDDWWFHISGTDCEAQGTYFVWDDCSVTQPDWQGAPNFPMISDPPPGDAFEIRIPFSKISTSVGDTIGLGFDVEYIPTQYGVWPIGMSMDSPATWGTAVVEP